MKSQYSVITIHCLEVGMVRTAIVMKRCGASWLPEVTVEQLEVEMQVLVMLLIQVMMWLLLDHRLKG